ncbi:MAG: radical SAM protein [Candidatus Zixiibacteriota bacterium]
MARVMLIEPPFAAFMGFSRWFYPVGLSFLADDLMQQGHDVEIFDADHTDSTTCFTYLEMLDLFPQYRLAVSDLAHPIYTAIVDEIKRFQPDVVGISCMTVKVPSAVAIARLVKQNTGPAVVCGGPHATALPEQLLEYDCIDYVVRGSALPGFTDLVNSVVGLSGTRPERIAGLTYRLAGGSIEHGPEDNDLSVLKQRRPRREALRNADTYSHRDLSIIMTSFGCPYRCRFCSNSIHNSLAYRSLSDVFEEISTIVVTYGSGSLYFRDDTFSASTRRLKKITDYIAGHQGIRDWECLTRIDTLDADRLQMLSRSKCSMLKVGIESGSERILKRIDKKLTPTDVVNFAKTVRDANLHWSAFFMIGFPEETEQDIQDTIRLIEQCRPDHVSMSLFTPYPGSQYYDDLLRNGQFTADLDWGAMDPFCLVPQFRRAIPERRFDTLAREVMAFVDHYNNGQISQPASA